MDENKNNNYTTNNNDDYYINDYDDVTEQTTEKSKFDFSNLHINKKLLLIVLGVIILILIIILSIKGCTSNKGNGSVNLKSLTVTDGTLSPKFSSSITEYSLITSAKSVYIECGLEDSSAKTTGCNSYMDLDEETTRNIIVSNKGKSKTYTISLGDSDTAFIDSVTGTSDEWTNQDVVLTVNVKTGVVLADEAYSFDDGSTWQKENTKSFSENKDVSIKVKNIDNKESSPTTVKISNIDKTEPKVTISNSNKKLTAKIEPETTPSTYTYKWYKDGKLISVADKETYTATSNGSYKLLVITKSGNSATSNTVTIGATSTSKPSTSKPSTSTQKPSSQTTTVTYKVNYNANGGSNAPATQTKSKDKTLKLSSTKPTRTGYTFSSWNTSSNGSGTKYNSGGSYTSNSAVILYAQWTKNYTAPTNKNYTIGYNGNNKNCTVSNLSSSQTKLEGTKLTLTTKVPTCSGYTFSSWNTSSSGSGTKYYAGATYTLNASATLYAQWTRNARTFTATLKKGTNVTSIGNSSLSCTTTSSSCQITLPSITTLAGYYTGKWTYGSSSYTPGAKVTISSNATFTANAQVTKSVSISTGTNYCSFYHSSTVAYTSNVSGSNCKSPLSEQSRMTVTSATKTISGKNLTVNFNLQFVTGTNYEYLGTGFLPRRVCITKGTNFNKTACIPATIKEIKSKNDSWGTVGKSVKFNKSYSTTISNYGDFGTYGIKIYAAGENLKNPTTMESPFSFQTGPIITVK